MLATRHTKQGGLPSELVMERLRKYLFAVAVAGFFVASAAGGWYVWSTFTSVQSGLPVDILKLHRKLTGQIQVLSNLTEKLHQLETDTRQSSLDELTIALDAAFVTMDAYSNQTFVTAEPKYSYIEEEIGTLMDNIESLLDAPNTLRAKLLHTRLTYTLSELENSYLAANEKTLLALTQQSQALGQLRINTLLLLAIIAVAIIIVLSMLMWSRNVNKRLRRTRNDLAHQTEFLETTLESIDQGFAVWDRDDHLVLWNDRSTDFWFELENIFVGLRRVDLLQHLIDKKAFINGDSGETAAQRLQKTHELGPNSEETLRMSDGRHVHLSQYPMPNGGTACVYTDITDRKHAEEQLNQSMKDLVLHSDKLEKTNRILSFTQAAIDQVADSILFIKTRDASFGFISQQINEIYGFSRDELLSMHVWDIAPELTKDSWPEFSQSIKNNTSLETFINNKNGDKIPVDFTIDPFEYKGDSYIIANIRDITEHKEIEKNLNAQLEELGSNRQIMLSMMEDLELAKDAAQEATKAKATFLATMSHEIRTPMGGIIGMVDILQHTEMTDDQQQMIGTVRDSAHSLLTIINDILDFSKIEAGKLELEEIPISVRNIVEGAGEALAVNARNKNMGLSVYVDPDIPDALIGDQVRVRQILFNFGSNAIKFTEQGKVLIRADKVPSQVEGKITVRFQVIDEGIGISKEAQEKLFQAFSQVDESMSRRFGGTGLGLSICQRLTEMMNGEIGVESTPGEGSSFSATISFPVAKEHSIKSDGQDLADLNVLLAHKDDDMRELIPRYLEHWKATVNTIADIDKTKTMVMDAAKKGNPFDVVCLGSGWPLNDKIDCVQSMLTEKSLSSTSYVISFLSRVKADRKDLDNTVYVDAGPLRREDFIKKVAVAAGRANPDVYQEDTETTLNADKAPTVAEAEAMGQLILLAEDNITNQDVIRRQLTMLGYALEIANDGKEALEFLESRSFSVLLTDCHMPNMDGFELTETIRRSEKDKDIRLPIIAITASVMKEEVDRCFAADMDDCLAKPLEMSKLKTALNTWMPETAVGKEAPAVLEKPRQLTDTEKNADGPIDPSALKDVFGDDEETFREILGDFVLPSQSIASDIEKAYSERAAAEIGAAAHKLKSSARSVGANELADLCQALETAGKADDWNEIDKAMSSLSGAVKKVIGHIDNL